jgi:chemotaxis protein histidine kinase CheA
MADVLHECDEKAMLALWHRCAYAEWHVGASYLWVSHQQAIAHEAERALKWWTDEATAARAAETASRLALAEAEKRLEEQLRLQPAAQDKEAAACSADQLANLEVREAREEAARTAVQHAKEAADLELRATKEEAARALCSAKEEAARALCSAKEAAARELRAAKEAAGLEIRAVKEAAALKLRAAKEAAEAVASELQGVREQLRQARDTPLREQLRAAAAEADRLRRDLRAARKCDTRADEKREAELLKRCATDASAETARLEADRAILEAEQAKTHAREVTIAALEDNRKAQRLVGWMRDMYQSGLAHSAPRVRAYMDDVERDTGMVAEAIRKLEADDPASALAILRCLRAASNEFDPAQRVEDRSALTLLPNLYDLFVQDDGPLKQCTSRALEVLISLDRARNATAELPQTPALDALLNQAKAASSVLCSFMHACRQARVAVETSIARANLPIGSDSGDQKLAHMCRCFVRAYAAMYGSILDARPLLAVGQPDYEAEVNSRYSAMLRGLAYDLRLPPGLIDSSDSSDSDDTEVAEELPAATAASRTVRRAKRVRKNGKGKK